jgi:hypothetical protein
MTDDRSNSAAERDALLAQAKEHITKGDEHYRLAREAVLEAKKRDSKLSNRRVAVALGRSHAWVNDLLSWDGRDASTPFGGGRDLGQGVRRAIRENPDIIVAEVLKNPDIIQRIDAARASRPANGTDEVDTSDPASDEPVSQPILRRHFDTVEMGDHVLVVGDSTDVHSKLEALSAAGLPYLREFFDADAIEDSDGSGEMNAVVISDPPYGQSKEGITHDDNADWSDVYRLLKPRGGFAFCAFKPPFFRAAEDGIIKAGGVPIEYLALDKGGGRMWGGDRVQNRLDGIVYFERAGHQPWKAGRRTVSLLRPDRSRAAMDERKRVGGGHATPKYIDVLITLIKLATDPGDVVVDPFTGSGTTLVACQRLGRRFIGVEYEPKWAERAVRNWQDETGEEAIVHRDFASGPISLSDLERAPTWGDYIE